MILSRDHVVLYLLLLILQQHYQMLVNIHTGLMMAIVMMETTMKNVVGMVKTVVVMILIQHFVLPVNALIQMQLVHLLRDHQDLVDLLNGLMMVIVMMTITMKIVFGMVMTAVGLMLRQLIVQLVNVLIQITQIHQLLPLQVLQLHLLYPLTVVCIVLIVLQILNLANLLISIIFGCTS